MVILSGIRKGLVVKTASHVHRQLCGCKKINDTAERSRTAVTRPARRLYVQVIDNIAGRTLAFASTMEADLRVTEDGRFAKAYRVGEIIAQCVKETDIENIVFDRAGNRYHDRTAAPVDAAREAGLGFRER